eukprot:958309_1
MTETSNPSPLPTIMGVSNSLQNSNITSSSEPILKQQIQDDNVEKDGDNITKEIIKVSPTPSNNDDDNSEDHSNTSVTDSQSHSPDNPNPSNPKLPFSSFSGPSFNNFLANKMKKTPQLLRTQSCPEIKYDDCREFDSFSGKWVDSKGQDVLISPWGVIRYPNNPKLRFEATYLGPNHLSVTFDKDPKRRKFVGKLNHECTLLIWSNDTKWAKKGSKNDPKFDNVKNKRKNSKNRTNSCLIQ